MIIQGENMIYKKGGIFILNETRENKNEVADIGIITDIIEKKNKYVVVAWKNKVDKSTYPVDILERAIKSNLLTYHDKKENNETNNI